MILRAPQAQNPSVTTLISEDSRRRAVSTLGPPRECEDDRHSSFSVPYPRTPVRLLLTPRQQSDHVTRRPLLTIPHSSQLTQRLAPLVRRWRHDVKHLADFNHGPWMGLPDDGAEKTGNNSHLRLDEVPLTHVRTPPSSSNGAPSPLATARAIPQRA